MNITVEHRDSAVDLFDHERGSSATTGHRLGFVEGSHSI